MSDKPAPKKKAKAKRKVIWVPRHGAFSPIGAEDQAAEIKYYDATDPPPGAPGGTSEA